MLKDIKKQEINKLKHRFQKGEKRVAYDGKMVRV